MMYTKPTNVNFKFTEFAKQNIVTIKIGESDWKRYTVEDAMEMLFNNGVNKLKTFKINACDACDACDAFTLNFTVGAKSGEIKRAKNAFRLMLSEQQHRTCDAFHESSVELDTF